MWSLCTNVIVILFDCGSSPSVTMACFFGGLWVLPQCNRESISWWNVAPSLAWPWFVSLHFLGGLWVLQQGQKTSSLVIPWEVLLQHDYDLFYWVEFGSFTSVKVICFLVDCGCFTSMTVIYFLEWTMGTSPTRPWSIFLVDYVSFSSMTMICFLEWTVGPSLVWPWGDHELGFLCGMWGLPQCDSEFHFMGGLCFFKHDYAKYACVSLQYVTASLPSMTVLTDWLYCVWMCLLTKNSGSVCIGHFMCKDFIYALAISCFGYLLVLNLI